MQYKRMGTVIGMVVGVLLLAGAGCMTQVPSQEQAREAKSGNAQKPSALQTAEDTQSDSKTAGETSQYASKTYVFRFSYGDVFGLQKESFQYGDEFHIVRKSDRVEVGTIGTQFLDSEDWDRDEYADATTRATFLKTEEIGGEGWGIYTLTNNQGHLISIACHPDHCDWILDAFSIDASLGMLNRTYLVGDWKTDGDVEEVSLYQDGSYASFLNERSFDSGTWTFGGNRLVLTSDGEASLNKSYAVSQSEGAGQLLLQNDDGVETWNAVE